MQFNGTPRAILDGDAHTCAEDGAYLSGVYEHPLTPKLGLSLYPIAQDLVS